MDQHEHSFRLVFRPERPACRKPLVLHAAAIARRTEAMSALPARSAPRPPLTVAKLRHDADQFNYLQACGILGTS